MIIDDIRIGKSRDFREAAAAAAAAAGALELRSRMREMKGVMSSLTTVVPHAARRVSKGRWLKRV